MFAAKQGYGYPAGRLTGGQGSNTSLTYTAQPNATTSTAQFKFGSSSMNSPDATNDFIYTTDANATFFDFGTGDFTVEFWVYIPSGSRTTEAHIMVNNQAGGFGLRLGATFGAANLDAVGIFARAQADLNYYNYTWPRDTWNFVAVTRKSAVIGVWANGTKLSLSGGSGAETRNFATRAGGSQCTFGNYGPATSSPGLGPGYLDEVCITNGTSRYDPGSSSIPVPSSAFFVDTYTSQLLHMEGANGGTSFSNATS